MTVLGLDTTGEFGSIAIRRNGRILAEIAVHAPDGFAHVLFPHVELLLQQAQIVLADVDCFAAANGPGSFTGVRIGLTAVKGLAEAASKPVAAISNLRALAAAATSKLARAAVLDARRGEIYAAVYDAQGANVLPETVGEFHTWLAMLPAAAYEWVCPAGFPLRDLLSSTAYGAALVTEAQPALAAAVTLCAEQDAAAGRLITALEADANYVRRSDAELRWHDRGRT